MNSATLSVIMRRPAFDVRTTRLIIVVPLLVDPADVVGRYATPPRGDKMEVRGSRSLSELELC